MPNPVPHSDPQVRLFVIAMTEVHAHESKIQGRTAIGSEAYVRARKILPDRRFSKENPVPPEK